MRRLLAPLVLVPALAVPAAHAATATTAKAKAKSCEAGFTEGRAARAVRATGVSCSTARAVAERVSGGAPSGCVKFVDKKNHVKLVAPCARLGYTCTARSIQKRLALSVTCTRGGKSVRFTY